MIKCKLAIDSSCGKDCCCNYCDEFPTCTSVSKCYREREFYCESRIDSETALAEFTNNAMWVIEAIAKLEKTRKEIEEKDKEMKAQLKQAMKDFCIKSFDNDILKVTYVAPTTKTTVDSTKLKKEQPEIYEKYSKQSKVSSSIRVTVK